MPIFDENDFKGVVSSRVRRPYKRFELLLDDIIGERVRADGACGVDLWCPIAGVPWRSPDGDEVAYSYRQACDLVAWVREEVDGFQWYCSGDSGIAADWITQALGQAGWSPLAREPAAGAGRIGSDDARAVVARIISDRKGHHLGSVSLRDLRDNG